MAPSRSNRLITALALFFYALPIQALYFYMDASKPKCFFEELPKDTLVVGHYEVQQHNPTTKLFESDRSLGLQITVEETFDAHHRIVNQRGDSKGRFTFSAADSGEHRICFLPTGHTSTGGWLIGGQDHGSIKLILDLAIGETSAIESSDKTKLTDLTVRVRDLYARLQDIRREQVYTREREAEFRDQSESTNARVVKWTLIQLAVLGITCAWQLSHLRSFFIKQKLT